MKDPANGSVGILWLEKYGRCKQFKVVEESKFHEGREKLLRKTPRWLDCQWSDKKEQQWPIARR